MEHKIFLGIVYASIVVGVGLILYGLFLFQSSILLTLPGMGIPAHPAGPNIYLYPLDVIGIALTVVGTIVLVLGIFHLIRGQKRPSPQY